MSEAIGAKGKILIIEDDLSIQNLLSNMFKPLNFSLEFSRCGHRGIDLYLKGAYCLIITDIHLPGVDGHYIADYIKKREPSMPIIGMSGLPFRETENFCHTFNKPFNVRPFMKTVHLLSEPLHGCIKRDVRCHNL